MTCAGAGTEAVGTATAEALQPPKAVDKAEKPLCQWQASEVGEGLQLVHQHAVAHVTWHARGDYFSSVAPTGNTQVQALWPARLADPRHMWVGC